VRNGRRAEFASFAWQGEAPDPQAEETFERAKLNWALGAEGKHAALLDFYRELLRLRKTLPALKALSKERMEVGGAEEHGVLQVRRWDGDDSVLAVFHLGQTDVSWDGPGEGWTKVLESSESRWHGPGEEAGLLRRRSVALYRNEQGS
jgi:maltooligosyltrehalose trehalohydrolase